MKSLVVRTGVALAMVATLAVATPALASAKGTFAAGLTATQQYRAALRTYNFDVTIIERTFRLSCAEALSSEKAALRAAKTVGQRYLARINYSEARAAAIAARQSALTALGPPPQPPVSSHSSAASTSTTTTAPNSNS